MPKIKITEIDNTGVIQSSAISNTVYIPGKVVMTEVSIEPKLFTSIAQLRSYNYEKYSSSGNNTALKYDDTTLSYKLMEHLLTLGLYVLYEGITEVSSGICPEINWGRLEDKSLYDIRFLTMGQYGVVQAGMLNCASNRGDCVALLDHPTELTSGYNLYEEKPADWDGAWVSKYNGNVYTKVNVYSPLDKPKEFIKDVYYSRDGVEEPYTYTVLTEQPEDWNTNYSDYYYISDVNYVAYSSVSAPTFETNTFYAPGGGEQVDKVRTYFESFKSGDTSFSAAFTPGFKTALPSLGASIDNLVHIPASFGYLFAYANSVKYNPEWYAVAGGSRGMISELYSLEYNYTTAEIERLQGRAKSAEVDLDADEDNVGCAINPIAFVRPFGNIIWGNRTFKENDAIKKTTAKSFLNVRNLVSAVKKSMYEASKKCTFEPNSEILWVNFKSQIIPLLDQMKSGNGILGYKFVKLATPAKARLKARLIIMPIEAVEDFEIEVELADSISTTEE